MDVNNSSVNDFKKVKTYPTVDDIKRENVPKLSKNLIHESYQNTDHYLKTNFDLIREEMVRPLVDEINNFKKLFKVFKESVEKERFELKYMSDFIETESIDNNTDLNQTRGEDKIRIKNQMKALRDKVVNKMDSNVFFDIKLTKPFVGFNRNYGMVLNFTFDYHSIEGIDLNDCHPLMSGGILCLSSDFFEKSIILGIIASSELGIIEPGTNRKVWKFSLKLDLDNKAEEFVEFLCRENTTYIGVESPTYYEGFRYTLTSLQDMPQDFPFKRYIVDNKIDIKGPPYLTKDSVYDMSCIEKKGQENVDQNIESIESPDLSSVNIQMNDVFGKDGNDLDLLRNASLFDKKQFDAFYAALTKELCVIEGPPGTGKTFVGRKVVECLLKNRKIWDQSYDIRPILIVCFKNKALDQFLEGIIKFNKNVVRIGGKCESEELEDYKLFTLEEDFKEKLRQQKSGAFDAEEDIEEDLPDYERTGEHKKHTENPKLELKKSKRKDYYKLLGVAKNATEDEIKKAYKRLAMTHHPDRHTTSSEAEKKEHEKMFKEIGEAYAVLSEPKKRSSYDNGHDLEGNGIDFDDDPSNLSQTFESSGRKPGFGRSQDPFHSKFSESGGATHSGGQRSYFNNLNNEENTTNDDQKADNKFGKVLDPVLIEKYKDWKAFEGHLYSSFKKSDKLVDKVLESFEKVLEFRDIMPYIRPQSLAVRFLPENNFNSLTVWLNEENDQNFKDICRKRLKQTKFDQYKKPETQKRLAGIAQKNFLDMDVEERWLLYLYWRDSLVLMTRKQLNKNFRQMSEEIEKLMDKKVKFQRMLCKGAEVIGLTVTGAAKYKNLVNAFNPKIMIVEEAAEVLEAHVVAAIPSNVQHLILIGDHKQLRPLTNVQELTVNYSLDISLFERLVQNKLPFVQLELQHRMRPSISELLKIGKIYDNLRDSAEVLKYPDIKYTFNKNIYFIDHQNIEDNNFCRDVPTKSHSNLHEAKYVLQLIKYFLSRNYPQDKITVLAAYNAQTAIIKKLMLEQKGVFVKTMVNGRGEQLEEPTVRVSSIDGFQGEENDIIIISFVRSSKTNAIGFLEIKNRVNVALSRARHGLFCIGNFTIMAREAKTDMWAPIVKHLEKNNCFGEEFTIGCKCTGQFDISMPGQLEIMNLQLENGRCRCVKQ